MFENTESTKRQYGLRERAIALGWPADRVVVIDSDLGQSGADSDREGFQRLVAAVGLGEVGVVLGLEVSRLARSSSDWHRLLEICALTDTLILDEDGIYNPAQFNDRLLLGLKGTMSEAELHVLRARLIGGQLAKASRGELEMRLPVGLVNDAAGTCRARPRPARPRRRPHLLRDLRPHRLGHRHGAQLRRAGVVVPAPAVQRAAQRRGGLGPATPQPRPARAEEPSLHGRVCLWAHPDPQAPRRQGAAPTAAPRTVAHGDLGRPPRLHLLGGLRSNLARLHENAQANGAERRKSPPREGQALLQGLVVCGRCGERMTIRYHVHHGQRARVRLPEARHRERRAAVPEPARQGHRPRGRELLVSTVTPLALEMALTVHDELLTRADQADALRHQQVERARYEAELAQRRYLAVDPDNRLVAQSLEAEWDHKLRALRDAQDDYERRREADGHALGPSQRDQILALASDFPRLWADPAVPQRERKRMVRLLVEDVTLLRTDKVAAHVRFRGGATHSLFLPLPLNAAELRKVDPAVVAEVDRLLEDHTDSEIVDILNSRAFVPAWPNASA